MHLVHPNLCHVTIICVCVCVCGVTLCMYVLCDQLVQLSAHVNHYIIMDTIEVKLYSSVWTDTF